MAMLMMLPAMLMLQQDEPAMPKGKDAVNLGREGFRQVGKWILFNTVLHLLPAVDAAVGWVTHAHNASTVVKVFIVLWFCV